MAAPDGPNTGPVAETARIDAIDVLRGVALLGILLMNVQSFSMPQAAYFNPTAYGDLEGANLYVWVAGRMLADQKFMTIFSMLFGAGIVLMAGRAEARGDARRVHYRRMGWLLVIGLLHAHLLWPGDVLFLYAVCGMLVYPLRRQPPGRLLALGAGLLAVASAYSVWSGVSFPYWPEAERVAFTAGTWQPPPARIEEELAAWRGGWLDQQPVRSAGALEFETYILVAWGVWRAGGLMLIGMALFRYGVFGARRPARFYTALVAAGVAVGLPLQAWGIALDFAYGWPVWVVLRGCAAPLLAEHRGQPRPCRRGHAGLPDGGASRPGPSVGGRGPDGAEQLPAANGPLHHDLLRPWPRLVRVRGSCRADRRGGRGVGGAARRLAVLAAPLPLRTGRVGLAMAHLRRASAVAENAGARTLRVSRRSHPAGGPDRPRMPAAIHDPRQREAGEPQGAEGHVSACPIIGVHFRYSRHDIRHAVEGYGAKIRVPDQPA